MRINQLALVMAVLLPLINADPASASTDSTLSAPLAPAYNFTSKLLRADTRKDQEAEDRVLISVSLAESVEWVGSILKEALINRIMLTFKPIGNAEPMKLPFADPIVQHHLQGKSSAESYKALKGKFGEKAVARLLVSAEFSYKNHMASAPMRKAQHAEWIRLTIHPDNLLARLKLKEEEGGLIQLLYSFDYDVHYGATVLKASLLHFLKSLMGPQ